MLLACAALILLLAGCGQGRVTLVPPEQGQGTVSLWYYDGQTTVFWELSQEDGAELIDQVNGLSARRQESFDAASAPASPLYGLCVDQGDYDFQAVVCGGVWLDSDGGLYSLEADLQTLWTAFAGEETEATLTQFPYIRALAQSGQSWNTAFLEEGVIDPPLTDLLTLTVVRMDEENRELRVNLENHDLTTYSTSRWKFGLQVWVDGEWYEVPYATVERVDYPSEAWDVTRHLGQGFTLYLDPYGDLPAGTYRATKTVSNIYGLAPDATVVVEFTL